MVTIAVKTKQKSTVLLIMFSPFPFTEINVCMYVYVLIFTRRRSVTKRCGCFQRCLFVSLSVCTVTSKRRQLATLYKNLAWVQM